MKKLHLTAIITALFPFFVFAQNTGQMGMTDNTPKIGISKVAGYFKPVSTDSTTRNIFDATKRGITTNVFNFLNMKSIGNLKPTSVTIQKFEPCINLEPNLNVESKKHDKVQTDYSDWIFTDSLSINSFLPAGGNIGVKINIHDRKLELVSPYTALAKEAEQAIAKAPKWIRPELECTLSKLKTSKQKEFAALINNAVDPYIDEIAFSIAYTPATFLGSSYCYSQLFVDNANLIYSHDSDLNYVEIVDYGTSTTDTNYYSTVKYWKLDSTRGKIQIEVPMDIYYMYLVHPKITDEIPTFINPELTEPDYRGWPINNISAPPTGVFWRDYLYTHTEPIPDTTGLMFPILKDSVSVCDVLWDDRNETKQAVREITKWVNDVMNFTSEAERPHQPVRIYDLHIGRCGEHEDITAAAARACLIPCRGIEAYSIDHVWNEFWDEKWWQWEPVNNSHKNPLAYITWGKFGTVVARKSCGVTEQVTSVYNDNHNSVINITALDASSKPIDGAVIKIYKNIFQQGQEYIIFDTYGITGNDGKCSFTLGKDNKYYARLETSLGNVPASENQVAGLVENPPEGRVYDYNINTPNSKPEFVFKQLFNLKDSCEDFVLKIDFEVQNQIVNWKILLDDLGGLYSYCTLAGSKNINVFIFDEVNYNKLLSKSIFDAWNMNSEDSRISFDIPAEKNWYAVLNNSANMSNYQHIKASFSLYRDPAVSVENVVLSEAKNLIAEPNPFNTKTKIKYLLSQPGHVKLDIYSALGNKIVTLVEEYQLSGEHDAVFNSENYPSGIYYYTLQTGSHTDTGKMVLLR